MPEAFTHHLLSIIQEQGDLRILPKGGLLLREGEVEHHLYLVESGLLRAYRLTATEEQTIRFGYAGSLINSLES